MKYIISAKKYFFIHKKIPNNLKINMDMLLINYKEILPFKNIKYIKKGENLYIYSIKEKTFAIPEGFILFQNIQKDGIYYFKNKSYYNILIVKNNSLIKDFYLNNIDNIELLEFEHNLESRELNYKESLKKGLTNNLLDLIKLSGILNIDKNLIINESSKILNVTLFISIVFIIVLYIYQTTLEKKTENLFLELNQLKKETNVIEKDIFKIEKINKVFSTHIDTYNKLINIYNEIVFSIPKNYRLTYINNQNNKIIFTVDGNDSLPILTNLNKIPELKKIKLVSTYKINKKITRFKFESEYK